MTQVIPPNYGIVDGMAFYVTMCVKGNRQPQVKMLTVSFPPCPPGASPDARFLMCCTLTTVQMSASLQQSDSNMHYNML